MEEHAKYYKTVFEYEEKKNTFRNNRILIEKLNKEQETFGSDVEFALNQFADMTVEESY